jgi:hypothetical protein
MKKLAVLFALLGVAAMITGASAKQNIGSVGKGHGIAVHSHDSNPCAGSNLMLNYDGSGENGYAWQYGGEVAPYYGAFAEGYNGNGCVCGVALFLTQVGYNTGQLVDAYVFGSDGNNPTTVLSTTTGLNPGSVAFWPSISESDLAVSNTPVSGDFFVGFWGEWPGALAPFYIAADLNGFGGLPRTNIAPGIGYPTGWNDPSIIWGTTMAMGIGAYVTTDCIVPTHEATWGAIKHLYN